MGIPVHGKTEDERQAFALGYRMGMFDAVKAIRALANEAGEIAGTSNPGPYTTAATHVERKMPGGKIVTTHELV